MLKCTEQGFSARLTTLPKQAQHPALTSLVSACFEVLPPILSRALSTAYLQADSMIKERAPCQ